MVLDWPLDRAKLMKGKVSVGLNERAFRRRASEEDDSDGAP